MGCAGDYTRATGLEEGSKDLLLSIRYLSTLQSHKRKACSYPVIKFLTAKALGTARPQSLLLQSHVKPIRAFIF